MNELVKVNNGAIAVYDKIANPMDYALQMGEFLYKSGMFRLDSREAGAVVALQCQMEGITPFDHLRTYHMIQGKPAKKADAMLAEFRTRFGGDFREIESSSERAAIEITWKGETKTYEFTWEQAKESRWPWKDPNDHTKGLKDNWSTPPDREVMLWARLVSKILRRICPEIVAGIYTPEEMEDVASTPAMRPVSPSGGIEGTVVSSTVITTSQEADEVPFDVPAEPAYVAANAIQVARLCQLFEKAGLQEAQIVNVLEKRNCSEIEQLTPEQADQLIERLEEQLKLQ